MDWSARQIRDAREAAASGATARQVAEMLGIARTPASFRPSDIAAETARQREALDDLAAAIVNEPTDWATCAAHLRACRRRELADLRRVRGA